MRHIGQKILALSLSILLWYMVNDTRLENKVITRVPLRFSTENLPSNMYHELSGQPYVSFTIRGPQEDIQVVGTENFYVNVPLKGVNVGENTVILDRSMVSIKDVQEQVRKRIVILPGTLVPDRVAVKILYHMKEIPVRVVTSGEPAKGYVISDKNVVPQKVWVTGAKEELEHVQEISTKTLDVTNINSSMKVNVTLDYADLPVQPLSDSDIEVQVEFIVKEK